MGIDIYMRWTGQTEEEIAAQFTGFSIVHGHVGYLREAYHGGPYATRILVPESFESENGEAEIRASVLRERLPLAMETVINRALVVYKEKINESDPSVKAFSDFVELAERKEKETGEPVTIIASH
jgi:hypothetical protein